MTEKTNLFPNLIRFRETNRLKMAIAASIMLWCATPQQAAADTYEKHEIASVQQQKVKTTGTVLDQNGEAMIGVSVKVKDNATMGTITDLEGKFSIDAPKGATLEISYIGYKTVTVKAEGTALHITMKEDAEVLDEVVIVGYGSQKKVNVTGAVGMVNSEVLEARPVQNVSQALQGVVPGLNLSVGNSGGALDSSMSINIRGAGTNVITIDGVDQLAGCFHEIIPDRIEAATYIVLAAAAAKEVRIDNIIPHHLEALLSKLKEIGTDLEIGVDNVVIRASRDLKAADIKTLPYPGFATDIQQPLTALLTQAQGQSIVTETIYTERFKHCQELNKMGANINVMIPSSFINGPTPLSGAEVYATDLRCGACLVIAGLIADGVTTIHNIYHIERGYEHIDEKLTALGAKIWRETVE